MSDPRERVVVVGSGPSGLAAALVAAARVGGENVRLIEEAASLGGLWRSFDYGDKGRFDFGMHNYFECGIPEIDDFFFGLLAEDDRHILEGANRDLAGVFFRGRLQANSPSIDLRDLDPADREQCLQEVVRAAERQEPPAGPGAMDYARVQWGPTIAGRFIEPIVERQFAVPAAELGTGALDLTALRRVILLDEADMLRHMEDEALRQRLAFPEQRRLPAAFASGRRGLYPRRPGLSQLVTAALEAFASRGVQMTAGCKVTKIERSNGTVTALEVTQGMRNERIPCSNVIWSAGLRSLSALSSVPWPQAGTTPPRPLTLVNLLAPAPLADEGLHYFYCYDKGLSSFRVTCYRNYSPEAATAGGLIPYGLELVDVPADQAVAQAREELVQFGLIGAGEKDDLVVAGVEAVGRIFPMPTLGNEAALASVRDGIQSQRMTNLRVIGSQATPGLFFQPDVLRHLHAAVGELLD